MHDTLKATRNTYPMDSGATIDKKTKKEEK
jgi:hypothetical protein